IAGDFNPFEAGPITNPIILQRNGRRFEYTGETTIGSGAEIRVETARDSLALSLREMDQESFVIFELPGFATAAGGAEADSLASHRQANKDTHDSGGDTLWVKLVVEDANQKCPVVEQVGTLTDQASIEVQREGLGG